MFSPCSALKSTKSICKLLLLETVLGKPLPVCIAFTFCYSLDIYTGSTAQTSLYAGNDGTFFHSPSLRGSTCKISGCSEIRYV